MSEKIKDGGPAFPCPADEQEKLQMKGSGFVLSDHTGMTLRDYFAAKAMATLIQHAHTTNHGIENGDWIARSSYEIADQMLKSRETS